MVRIRVRNFSIKNKCFFTKSAEYTLTYMYLWINIKYMSKDLSKCCLRERFICCFEDRSLTMLLAWLIDWIVFYAVSAIFQPFNGGDFSLKVISLEWKFYISLRRFKLNQGLVKFYFDMSDFPFTSNDDHAVTWLEYCRNGANTKHQSIKQSIQW